MIAAQALFAASKPFEIPPAGKLFNYEPLFKIGGLAITYPILVMLVVTAIVGIFFWRAFARAKLVPVGSQNLAEASVDFVRLQITSPVLGEEGPKWLPFLTAVFFWVLLNNLMGLIPGIQIPTTSAMGYPALLALLSWIIYNGIGIKQQGFLGYFKGIMFPPGIPSNPLTNFYVKPLLAIIELFSTVIVRPLTLAVRLFANMVAGHMILTVLFIGTAVFLSGDIKGKIGVVAPFGLGIIMTFFELFVALMQAFIITILMAVYIQGAQEAHH